MAKLVDFGIAKQTAVGGDSDHHVAGSPLYMSPEQASRPEEVDGRSDIYSLGVTGYFLLSGRNPIEGGNALAILRAHRSQQPSPINDQCEVPADLAKIIMRCLEKDPGGRFANACEMRQSLEACGCAGDWSSEDARACWERSATAAESNVASV